MLTNAAENAENEDHDEKKTKALRLVYNTLDAFTPRSMQCFIQRAKKIPTLPLSLVFLLPPRNPFCPSFLIPNVSNSWLISLECSWHSVCAG